MVKSIRLNRRRTIELPASIFKPADRVTIVAEGNTVIVKKLDAFRLSDVAERSSGRRMSMKNILREIERYRKEKRS
jgi:virulence-associated protein VagC